MGQLYGQLKDTDGTTKWKPIAAIPQPDGTYHIAVDTELVLDGANISISNIKVGSTNQSSSTLKYLKVLDDGTLVAVSSPLDFYELSDTFEVGGSGIGTNYFGYIDIDGNWYILKEVVTSPTNPNSYRYFKGSGSYPAAWTNRAGHAYDYFNNIF